MMQINQSNQKRGSVRRFIERQRRNKKRKSQNGNNVTRCQESCNIDAIEQHKKHKDRNESNQSSSGIPKKEDAREILPSSLPSSITVIRSDSNNEGGNNDEYTYDVNKNEYLHHSFSLPSNHSDSDSTTTTYSKIPVSRQNNCDRESEDGLVLGNNHCKTGSNNIENIKNDSDHINSSFNFDAKSVEKNSASGLEHETSAIMTTTYKKLECEDPKVVTCIKQEQMSTTCEKASKQTELSSYKTNNETMLDAKIDRNYNNELKPFRQEDQGQLSKQQQRLTSSNISQVSKVLLFDEDNDFEKNVADQDQIMSNDNSANHNNKNAKHESNGNRESDYWKEEAKRMECQLHHAAKKISKLQKKYGKATSKLDQLQSFMKGIFAQSSSSPLSSTNTTPNSKTVSRKMILSIEKNMRKDIADLSIKSGNINIQSVAQKRSKASPTLIKVSGRIKRIKRESNINESDKEEGCLKQLFPSSITSSTFPDTDNCTKPSAAKNLARGNPDFPAQQQNQERKRKEIAMAVLMHEDDESIKKNGEGEPLSDITKIRMTPKSNEIGIEHRSSDHDHKYKKDVGDEFFGENDRMNFRRNGEDNKENLNLKGRHYDQHYKAVSSVSQVPGRKILKEEPMSVIAYANVKIGSKSENCGVQQMSAKQKHNDNSMLHLGEKIDDERNDEVVDKVDAAAEEYHNTCLTNIMDNASQSPLLLQQTQEKCKFRDKITKEVICNVIIKINAANIPASISEAKIHEKETTVSVKSPTKALFCTPTKLHSYTAVKSKTITKRNLEYEHCNENSSFSQHHASQEMSLPSSKISVKRKLINSETSNFDFCSNHNLDRSVDNKRKSDSMETIISKKKSLESKSKKNEVFISKGQLSKKWRSHSFESDHDYPKPTSQTCLDKIDNGRHTQSKICNDVSLKSQSGITINNSNKLLSPTRKKTPLPINLELPGIREQERSNEGRKILPKNRNLNSWSKLAKPIAVTFDTKISPAKNFSDEDGKVESPILNNERQDTFRNCDTSSFSAVLLSPTQSPSSSPNTEKITKLKQNNHSKELQSLSSNDEINMQVRILDADVGSNHGNENLKETENQHYHLHTNNVSMWRKNNCIANMKNATSSMHPKKKNEKDCILNTGSIKKNDLGQGWASNRAARKFIDYIEEKPTSLLEAKKKKKPKLNILNKTMQPMMPVFEEEDAISKSLSVDSTSYCSNLQEHKGHRQKIRKNQRILKEDHSKRKLKATAPSSSSPSSSSEWMTRKSKIFHRAQPPQQSFLSSWIKPVLPVNEGNSNIPNNVKQEQSHNSKEFAKIPDECYSKNKNQTSGNNINNEDQTNKKMKKSEYKINSSTSNTDDSINERNKFRYKETIRCKSVREGLPCYDCIECSKFYSAISKQGIELTPAGQNNNENDIDRKNNLIKHSRHRSRFTPPSTPDGFWELSFRDEIKAKNDVE